MFEQTFKILITYYTKTANSTTTKPSVAMTKVVEETAEILKSITKWV